MKKRCEYEAKTHLCNKLKLFNKIGKLVLNLLSEVFSNYFCFFAFHVSIQVFDLKFFVFYTLVAIITNKLKC